MQLNKLNKTHIPEEPGVYFFKKGRQILYIGKATNLRDRVRSYFASDLVKTRGMLLVDMVAKATSIVTQKTASVLEALLLETELIKKYQPHYNTKEKDNKSHSFVAITHEEYPAVITIRGRELEQIMEKNPKAYIQTFGPFTSGTQLKDALKIVRKLFPYRDERCRPLSGKPCFNASIGLCPGVCTGLISSKEYLKHIKTLILFLSGQTDKVVNQLTREMKLHAKKHEFELADNIKRKIYALTHIQDIALMKRERTESVRVEAYDVAHLGGKGMVGGMVVMDHGELQKDQYRKFIIRTVHQSNDPAALKEVLIRRFAHPEWPFPNVIVVDGNEIQLNAAKEIVDSYFTKTSRVIPKIIAVVKDDRHKARAILGDQAEGITKEQVFEINAEVHRFVVAYFRKKQRKDVYL